MKRFRQTISVDHGYKILRMHGKHTKHAKKYLKEHSNWCGQNKQYASLIPTWSCHKLLSIVLSYFCRYNASNVWLSKGKTHNKIKAAENLKKDCGLQIVTQSPISHRSSHSTYMDHNVVFTLDCNYKILKRIYFRFYHFIS